jgi:hypothetical protein
MDTPRHRFTVTPYLVAFFVALVHLPATTIVKVNAFGMGFEHEQPWRLKTSGLTAPIAFARGLLARLRDHLARLHRHALFWPALVGLAMVIWIAIIIPGALAAMPLIGGVLSEGRHAGEFLIEERASSRENITVLSGQNLKAGAVIARVKYGIGRVSLPTVVGTGTGTATVVFAGPEVQVGSYVLTCITAVANNGVFSLTCPDGKALPNATMSGGTLVYTSRHINFTLTDSADFVVGDKFTFVVDTTAPTVIGGTGTGVMTSLSLGPDAKPGRYQVQNRVVVANGGDFEVLDPDGESIGRFIWANSGSTAAFTSRHINFTLSDATDYIAANYFDIAVFNQLAGGKVVAWDPTTYDGRHRADGLLYDNVDASAADVAGVIVARDAAVIKGSLEWATAITTGQKESAYLDLAARGIVAR